VGGRARSAQRPALKRLLEDITASKVQTVVVYKVDRLTRSLADFAKIVDVLDAHNASFVSVTQQFNTTTSMGRLTLNMLLSFAQFEREIAGERIRDKIAASKKKGMWMGRPGKRRHRFGRSRPAVPCWITPCSAGFAAMALFPSGHFR
jgi:DNA invertase Pin-like site-specific DNA recombinase